MNEREIRLEQLDEANFDLVRLIDRSDVVEEFVDSVDTIMEYTRYGLEHGCIGRTYAVRYGGAYIGVILLGEAIEWESDPSEMKGTPFYRLLGFVIDKKYRGQGIGGRVLESVIAAVYEEFGVRPIALGVHQDNHAAARFYARHGFEKTETMEGNDYYYLRYPEENVF